MTRTTMLPRSTAGRPHVPHTGEHAVKVGSYEIMAGGTLGPLAKPAASTILVPLTEPRFVLGSEQHVIWYVLEDFGGIPDDWEQFLSSVIIRELQLGHRLLAFCAGGHGRTGTFLASLIALLEDEEETPDPIAAVRERHCSHAVETTAQAEAVFALRDMELPVQYR